jgi:hypothetical protein
MKKPRNFSGFSGGSEAGDLFHQNLSHAELEQKLEVELYREYNALVGSYRYSVETERRYYLANEVQVQTLNNHSDVYFDVKLKDAWVWDIYRSKRFLTDVHILTFRDVHVQENNPLAEAPGVNPF